MALSSAQKVLLAFVTLIIGIMLIATVASEVLNKTDYTEVVSEAHSAGIFTSQGANTTLETNITNVPTGWKAADCPISSVSVGNASQTFTPTTDYTYTAATGAFLFKNTAVVNGTSPTGANANTTYISYSYCGDEYMNLSWGRTVLNIVPGFFGIALLLISVGLFYSVAKDAGIIE